jgi:hypothetical protein
MNLSKEQELGFNQIELRVVLQRAIELIDDLNYSSKQIKNLKLKSNLKSIYGILEKETKKYNDLFEATPEGTTAFYDIVVANNLLVMRNHLLDKNLINKCIVANEINPKALDGILVKILKENEK